MLNACRIRRACAGLGFDIHCNDQVTSTNDLVKIAYREGTAPGYVVAAEKQVAGYGRQGRPWISPYGGIYFSLLLKPSTSLAALPSISPAFSAAIRTALANLSGNASVVIKWPNDVICSDGKLCGMSLETLGGGCICVGIGVNVLQPTEVLNVGGKNVPARLIDLMDASSAAGAASRSVLDDALDAAQERFLEDVLIACLTSLASVYGTWTREGFAALRNVYNDCAALIGDEVTVVTIEGQRIAAGTVLGIDDAGRLLLEDAAGSVTPVTSGEVHLV